MADLVYVLMDQLGRPDWCDPDFYPVARADELSLAKEHLAEMQSDSALWSTILAHNGLGPDATLTDEQLVTVYRDWKVLTKAIVVTPAGDGYSFDYVALRRAEPGGSTSTSRERSQSDGGEVARDEARRPRPPTARSAWPAAR